MNRITVRLALGLVLLAPLVLGWSIMVRDGYLGLMSVAVVAFAGGVWFSIGAVVDLLALIWPALRGRARPIQFIIVGVFLFAPLLANIVLLWMAYAGGTFDLAAGLLSVLVPFVGIAAVVGGVMVVRGAKAFQKPGNGSISPR